jgi:phage shock protein C
MEKRLYRDEFNKKIAGVCAGVAEYLSIDVTIVRVVFVLMAIFHGSGGLVYIILWIVLPKKPFHLYNNPTVDYTVPPQNPGDNTYSGNQFGNNTFGNSPFPNQPFTNQPFPNQPLQPQHKGTSLAAIIIGTILIIVGGSILLDNFDIIPDWDFWHLWPVVPITVGCILMISGENEKKKKAAEWQAATGQKEAGDKKDETESNPPVDNNPAV